jgi:hypothetical protein
VRIAIALVLCLAGTARAEAPVETVTTVKWDNDAAGSLSLTAESSTRTGVGVVAGAEGRFGAEQGCGVLATGGTAAARLGPAPVTATHWARVCLPTWRLVEPGKIDVTVFPIEIAHELAVDVVPRLSSKRIVWSKSYTSERLDIGFDLARIGGGEIEELGWSIVAAPIGFHLDWLYQPLDGGGSRLYEARHAITAHMLGGREDTQGGSIMIFGGRFEEDLWRIDLVTVDDVPLGSSGLLLDTSLGSSETLRYVDGEFVNSGGLTGRLGLGFARGRLRASAAIEKDYYQTIDDAVIGDARAEAELGYRRGRWSAIATAFRSRATLIYSDGSGQVDYDPTFGAEVELAFPIVKRLDGRLGGGWARSFYSRLEGTAPTVEPGFEVNAAVTAQLGKRIKR